jgi:uncharacterized protein (DUF433 family)
MTYRGTVKNGVVVFDGAKPPLAEGTAVRVEPLDAMGGGDADGAPAWEAGGIYKHPRVSGGDACVGSSRVPVWSLVRFRKLGRTDQQLLADFPSLSAADLRSAWAYAAAHRDEIERALLDQERA